MSPDSLSPNGPKILILEDETITAHHLQRVLTRLGYQVVGIASTGSSGLDLITQTNPDLLLADIGLDGELDGMDVAAYARNKLSTPTVFLTAYSDPETLRRARISEPYGYLVKPFEEKELHATIEIALQQKGLAQQRDLQVQTTAQILGRTRDELSVVAARLFQAQEQERERIARDLHDDVIQRLAILQINLECVLAKLPTAVRKRHDAEFEGVLQHVGQLSKDLRELSHRLHPQVLQDLGLDAALRELCRAAQQESLSIRFSTRNLPPSISPDASVAIYRVVQEALQNILKHANADLVNVALIATRNKLELSIRDNGIGFDANNPVKAKGIGLISMAQRAALAGGTFKIQSRPGRGTRIHVSLPFETSLQ